MTIDGMIAVLQAAKEGKTIQFRSDSGRWTDFPYGASSFFPNFETRIYRVKPEPREWWVGSCPWHGIAVKIFDAKPARQCVDCEVIHVREVIE